MMAPRYLCVLFVVSIGVPDVFGTDTATALASVERSRELHHELRGAVDALVGDWAEVAATLKLASSADEGGRDELIFSLFTKYPGILLINAKVFEDGDKFVTDAERLRTALLQQRDQFLANDPSRCFDSSTGRFRPTAMGCAEIRKDSCSRYGSMLGELFVEEVEGEALHAETIPIATEEDARARIASTFSTDGDPGQFAGFQKTALDMAAQQFHVCRAIAQWEELTPKEFSGGGSGPAAVTPLYFRPEDSSSPEATCFLPRFHEIGANLVYLAWRYPDSFRVKHWKDGYDGRRSYCEKTVQEWCGNAYVIGGEVILSYVTVDCRLREVTSVDVTEDIRKFEVQGTTHAERIKHAQLLEPLRFCKGAAENSFGWRYVAPTVTGCKPRR
jgi:hypothetical protein